MVYKYARVCLTDDIPYSLDRRYDYYIPAQMRSDIARGAFVTVPFGRGNRRRLALVVELAEGPEKKNVTVKSIDSLCPDSLSFDEELLGLCLYLKEQTLCTVGDAVHAMIPAAAMSTLAEIYRPVPAAPLSPLPGREKEIYDYILSRAKVSDSSLRSRFGSDISKQVNRLLERGLIERGMELKAGTKQIYREFYSLAAPEREIRAILSKEEGAPRLRSRIQIDILRMLTSGEAALEDLKLTAGAGPTQLKKLTELGLIKVRREGVERLPYDAEALLCEPAPEYSLNGEQTAAFEALRELSRSGEPRAALLHGVTGSGKTCVMVKIIDEVLSSGRSVILLLPEIALTPQSVNVFCTRYRDRVALIHSSLSAGERLDAYNRIKEGKATLVIGTRSAIFSPVKNLGLIIIDEEQEHTYKSDSDPKYHARDIARYRCAYSKALLLLCSATPSVESYQKAVEGKYTLLTLKSRYGAAPLPEVVISDMREQIKSGNLSPIGEALTQKLKETYAAGKQSVLFLNRRGYNNFVSCRECGEAIKCPNCSVALHYHTAAGRYDEGELVCHWCGHRAPLPERCPDCSSPHLVKMGFGTQHLEHDLTEALPEAKLLRMDADSTSKKASFDKMIGEFRRGDADILLGTQMVTKGHDFPNVTLVGVLLADASLYLDDYRANERTFALLTQVVGRAGRRDTPGVAVIQTNNPENEVIRLAAAQDYPAFFESEIRLRRLLVFPPFCDIVTLTLTSSDERELLMASAELDALLRELLQKKYTDVPTVIFGPMEAPVYRVEGKYRMRTVIKCRLNKRSRALFSELLSNPTDRRSPSLSVDFNPSGI